MNSQKVGRNAPCPCGSGKKYKKCCYGKDIPPDISHEESGDELPPHEKIDYGVPRINESFFKKNGVHEISAPRLLYSNMMYPGIDSLASRISNILVNRGRSEAGLIDRTHDVTELIDIMAKGTDPLNHENLRNKILIHQDKAIPIIIDKLQEPQTAAFVELAIEILHATGNDFSEEVLEVISGKQRDAYTISLLCILLGFYDNEKSEKIMWDYYHCFKEHFPDETYSDGPLLGLGEMWARRHEDARG